MGRFAREQQERQRNTLLVRHCLEVLELDPNGKYDHLALKSQYRKLARNYHPDHNGNENNPEAEDKMKDLNEAYGYLKEML
jgi:DnaJ-class molecular chaperone